VRTFSDFPLTVAVPTRTATLGTLNGWVGVTSGVAGAVVGAPAVVGVVPGALLGVLELLGLLVPPHAAAMSATSRTMIIEKVYLENFICHILLNILFCMVLAVELYQYKVFCVKLAESVCSSCTSTSVSLARATGVLSSFHAGRGRLP
jgi:hypothetical protein